MSGNLTTIPLPELHLRGDILTPFFHLSPYFPAMKTTLQNQAIVDAIASKIIDELNNRVRYSHESLHSEMRKFHEDCINEREVFYDDANSEQFTFDCIWEDIINSELFNLYDSLEGYSQVEVRNYVRDVYPDWRI